VCATCHSINQIHFRDLVGVAFTEDEAKELALNIEVTGAPLGGRKGGQLRGRARRQGRSCWGAGCGR
jgi:hypothetical protein